MVIVFLNGPRASEERLSRKTPPVRPQKLLGIEKVMILNSQSAHSYHSYAQTERHFGLGQRRAVDLSVEFHPSGKRVERKAAIANSTLLLSGE